MVYHDRVYIFIQLMSNKNDHLAKHKHKLKDTSFTFPVINGTVLSIFGTHAQEGYCKVLEMNSTSVFYSLALLLFEN